MMGLYMPLEYAIRRHRENRRHKMLDESAASYRIVLTKADKIKASELAAVTEATQAEARKHSAAYPLVHVTSSEKGMGIAELRGAIFEDALIQ